MGSSNPNHCSTVDIVILRAKGIPCQGHTHDETTLSASKYVLSRVKVWELSPRIGQAGTDRYFAFQALVQ